MLDKLRFDILANDQTGRAFASVRQSLKQTEGALASVQERTRRVGRSLSVAGGALSAAVSLPVAAFFKDSLTLFNQQDKAVAAVEQAVISTGKAAGFTAAELQKMASGLQSVTTVGDEDILRNVTAPLLSFTRIAGPEFERAQGLVLDVAHVMQTDLKSAALQVGKALNDPVKGLGGLSRAGIQFTDEQQEVIKTLAETGRVAEAQALILNELQTQFGGQAAAAAQTALGPLEQLSNSWGDLKEEVGAIVAEVLPPVVAVLKDIVGGFQALSPEVKRFIVIGAGLAAVIGPLVAAAGLFALAVGSISAPVLGVVAAIGALTAGVAAFWPEIRAAYDAVTGALTDLVAFIEQPLGEIVAQSRAYLVDQLGGVWEQVKGGLLAVRGVFVSIFGEEIVSAFEAFHVRMFETAVALMDQLRAVLVGGMEWIRDKVGGVLDWIGEKWQGLGDFLVFNSLVPDMVEAILAEFGRMREGVAGETARATEDVLAEMQRMNEGVRAGLDFGGPVAGFGGSDAQGQGFASLASAIVDPFRSALDQGKLSFKSFASSILSSADSLADELLSGAFANIEDALTNLFSGKGFALSGNNSGGAFGSGGLLGTLIGGLGSLLPGFAHGGEFKVGGKAGVDQNVVAFRASRNERVKVTPAGQAEAGGITINMPINVGQGGPRELREARAQVARSAGLAVRRAQGAL